MTQCERIIQHMEENGSITQREAYIDYGIQSFHRRIADLRERGYVLRGEARQHPVTKQEYTRYYLDAYPDAK
ncbi:helix-turn-helix domain-containing protein [uncultured Cohaesibacter sp.]|uniref:helix-turn-helix domain-containing protein n=1 Tax=uncultured Cohaesibacter sp. TaxID=1002546 RepID=UPI0029C83242|nr:helix-turn-helix domain-containing protein [uncultured Cohaesibacter sp.]